MKPYYKKLTLNHAWGFVHNIKSKIYNKVTALNIEYFKTEEPVKFSDIGTYQMKPVKEGEKWGELWDCAWFRFSGKLPENIRNEDMVFIIDLQGEGCVFDNTGTPVRGLTNINSDGCDGDLIEPGKRIIPVNEIVTGKEFSFFVEAGCNDLFGRFKGGRVECAHIATVNHELRSLYYDYHTLLLLCQESSENDVQHYSILYALESAYFAISKDFKPEEIIKARKILATELNRKNAPNPLLQYYAIGHAHMDLAWLWPIRETRRKIGRTFSNVLANMENYPDYIFGASQPQQYQWMKEDYPRLYEKFISKVKEGRIEAQGAMWVEADTNVTGGESLIRQIMYGNKFFREECGYTTDIVWLPDVFGFSAALPQIMKKSGIENFVTIKLSWSEFNQFPHNTFWWEGTDGSKVLVHMPPELTYNGSATPKGIKKATENFVEKGIVDKAMIIYGIGDGGGGPNRSHLERLSRMKNILGLPPVKQADTREYFRDLRKNLPELRVFKGEMYLERHQGTYTTQSRNKKGNRNIENALRTAEYLSVLAGIKSGYKYPSEELERIWKEALLYQFHDILPGSSIKRVYDESVVRYDTLIEEVNALTDKALAYLGEGECVLNMSPFHRYDIINKNGKWYEISAPAMSIAPLGKEINKFDIKVSDNKIENEFLKAVFDKKGKLISLKDKISGRETMKEGNRWQLYNDLGDAWDMNINYRYSKAGEMELTGSRTFINGAEAGIIFDYKFNNSVMSEKISLKSGAKALEFGVEIDWHEQGKMLRAEFDTEIITDSVTCDIQFGSIKRSVIKNYSREFAQYEICAHKYIDLSSCAGGLALINDCKYGYSAENSTITMNVLRSTDTPGIEADLGRHTFKFALLPHKDSVENSEVAAYSYEFNNSLKFVNAEPANLISIDKNNIVTETVKKAESSRDIIVRMYENSGEETLCLLKTGYGSEYCESDMTEKITHMLPVKDGNIQLKFTPNEIKTIIIRN